MGDNTLTTVAEPATVEVADGNQFFTALVGDSIPRNASTGAPEDNVHKLGRLTLRWKEAHIDDLFLGGSLFDPDAIGADTKFAINAGATRTDSEQPDFLRADGTGASAKILAATTDFQITANNTSVTVTADIAITSLTVAPSSNNTALVDDADLSGGNETKFTGEAIADPITIDTVGSEITDRIGEYICLKTPTGEFMFAFVEDATTLSRCFRGFFFDDTGTPVVRGVLSNNDTLTLMSLGWVFLDNNGTTVDVSYTSPVYNGVEPASPVTDDYWFDLKNRLWKRFNGSSFQQVDRVLIGLLVIDTTDCVAARSFDFTKAYDAFVDLEVEIQSNTEVKTKKGYSRISVYGRTQELYAGEFLWDITANLESGFAEASSTDYYIYVTEEGIPQLSPERFYDRTSELKGKYHPYHSWRFVGIVTNDGSSDFDTISNVDDKLPNIQKFTSSGTWTKPEGVTSIEITVVGGGGGGGGADTQTGGFIAVSAGGGGGGSSIKKINANTTGITETVTIGAGGGGGSDTGGNGSTGGTSSFGSHLSATGGTGGEGSGSGSTVIPALLVAGTGGEGSGGDVNMKGESGSYGIAMEAPVTEIQLGGNGGSSTMGGGGKGATRFNGTTGATSGDAGGDHGGGGGGSEASSQNAGADGGAGAAGLVIVTSRF